MASPLPRLEDAVTADRSWNGVPEWALGVTRWFEAGLYLPFYSYDHELGWGLDGFKLRTLFICANRWQKGPRRSLPRGRRACARGIDSTDP